MNPYKELEDWTYQDEYGDTYPLLQGMDFDALFLELQKKLEARKDAGERPESPNLPYLYDKTLIQHEEGDDWIVGVLGGYLYMTYGKPRISWHLSLRLSHHYSTRSKIRQAHFESERFDNLLEEICNRKEVILEP